MSEPYLTVYHDGTCPLCRLEIGYYQRQCGLERIRFIDVSDYTVDTGQGSIETGQWRAFTCGCRQVS